MQVDLKRIQIENMEEKLKEKKKVEATRGSKVVRFSGLSLTQKISSPIESEIFTVGQYKWRLVFYPSGIHKAKKGFMSMYLKLVSDKSLVQVAYRYSLLDPGGGGGGASRYNSQPLTSPSTIVFDTIDPSLKAACWGHLNFMQRKKLEEHPYFKDDSFTIKCTVDILKEFRINVISPAPVTAFNVPAPLLDLQKQLVSLWESGLGVDVSFEVGTRTFSAHRCVLAARSPVFRAQLFGPLKESMTYRSIVVHDMEAPVFKAMLRFMYSDESCPEIEDSVPMAQHLLVAADRYELERLRQICEDRLISSIDVATVATTLALAEQHSCTQLKAACLKFMTASPGTLFDVTLTEGFQHLNLSCPSIAKELLAKAASQCKSV